MQPDHIATLRTDLLEFSSEMFSARRGGTYLLNWHQAKICEALERVTAGLTKRLIINVSPRAGKTDLAVVNYIAWCMGNWPESEFIHASYSKRLAAANTYNVRALMQMEEYAQVFPWTALKSDSTAKDEFRTRQGGIVYATGSEGTITGYGAGGMGKDFRGAIIIDDPHKAGEALSVRRRESVVDWFSTTIESRKNSPHTPIILIMQRLHELDLSGWLLGGGNGEEWEHVCIPALDESDQSFWPAQFPEPELERMRAANPYVFAGQYMQRPSPPGGGIFKDEYWNFWSELPDMEWRAIYADTAQKTKEHNDFSVFQHWGKGVDGNAYLIDQVRGKWEAPDLLDRARDFWEECSSESMTGTLRAFKIEDKVSGTGLIQQLKRMGVPVQGIQRTTDKVTRAMDVVPRVASGHVYLPDGARWLDDYLAELSVFDRGAHDDQVDPTVDAINDMLIRRPVTIPSLAPAGEKSGNWAHL